VIYKIIHISNYKMSALNVTTFMIVLLFFDGILSYFIIRLIFYRFDGVYIFTSFKILIDLAPCIPT
jgi:hypothetical protein